MPGWTQAGASRSFEPDTLFDYMNGNSEGYFAYGFVLMHGVTCVNAAGDQFVIDVSELGDPERAWGIFVANRDVRSPIERDRLRRPGPPPARHLRQGPLLRRDRGEPRQGPPGALRAFVRHSPRGPGRGPRPRRRLLVPARRLDPDSIRMVPESVLGLRLLKSGFVAQYAVGRAFVVPEATPEAARPRWRSCGPASRARCLDGLGDEAIAAQDQYLGRLVIFRKGARVAGVANVAADGDAAPLAKALAGRLP